MFRFATSAALISIVGLLAGCSGAPGDDAAQSGGQAVTSKTDQQFLMGVLEAAGVPEVAQERGVLGVGPSRTANIQLKTVTGGFTAIVKNSGEVTSEDGKLYGNTKDGDFTRLEKVLTQGGVSWVKGEVRCCDMPVTDTLAATVSCHTVVAPGSPVNCTITPVTSEIDDQFMFDLFTSAGVAPDSNAPMPGSSTKYTAHVRLTTGGIAGIETGDLSWGSERANVATSDLARIEKVLKGHGSVWGVMGPLRAGVDAQSTLESLVTCWETVTVDPIAHCTYDAVNIRPL